MAALDFKVWYLSLPRDERRAYALAAGTSVGYLSVHLIYRRKLPRPELLKRLAEAAKPRQGPSAIDLARFFYLHDTPPSESRT